MIPFKPLCQFILAAVIMGFSSVVCSASPGSVPAADPDSITATVSTNAPVPSVLRIGISSFRDKAATLREWQPTMDFLAQHVQGTRFEAVPLNLPEFEGALTARTLDFVITNPQHYITVEAKHGVSRVATLVKSENGIIVNRFGGVIFTRATRDDIHDLADLRGKRIAATDKTSFAAYLIQYDMLRERGIDLEKDSTVLFFGFPQDTSVSAVLDGRADVGFVRSGLLEAMVREGRLQLRDLKIINRIERDDFPFLLSSSLFPEWPLAAVPHVSFDITNRIVAALLLMPPDSAAARSARYYRWSTPVEYQSVQNLMRRRHIYPFDEPERVQLKDILREYAVPLVGGASILLAIMVLLYLRSRHLNRALASSREELKQMAHYDALTGLPNRTLLDDRIERALAHARRSPHNIALCLLDLDGFKPVNDTFGHAIGDRVLRDVAQRMNTVLRQIDTVARLGGDEFVLLINDFADEAILDEVMTRVLASIAAEFPYCPDAKVRASIGVSMYKRDAHDATTLMRHADEAMYRAKARGGNCYVKAEPDVPETSHVHPASAIEGVPVLPMVAVAPESA